MELADKNILFVEDDEFIGDVITHHLQKAGALFKWVRDGRDALEMLKENSFDIILTDIVMEGMSGVEMLKQIRTQPDLTNIPVLILTNLGNDDEQVTEMRELGVAGFFAKSSTSFEGLIGVISCLLANSNNGKTKTTKCDVGKN